MRYIGSRWIGFTFYLFSLLILPTTALANDYYVATTGSDSNSGTQSQPWATISHAVSSFTLGTNGTVIHVAAGTYGAGIDMKSGGSSSSVRLVLQCDPGTASAITAKGQCKITGSTFGILVEANNVDIVGFDIGNNANMSVGLEAVCNATSAVACPTGNSVHFIGNYVHDLAQNVFNSAHTVGPGCPENGAIGGAAHSHTTSDQQYLRNFVLNFGVNPAISGCNVSQGLYFGNAPAGSPAIIQDNIVIETPVSGITNSDAFCNFVISNNTLIAQAHAIILSGSTTGPGCSGSASSFTIANNAMFGSTAAALGRDPGYAYNVGGAADCGSGVLGLHTHNITDGATADFNPAPASCDTVSPTPVAHLAGSSFFVNYQTNGTGDYHLASASAVTNPGSTQCVSGGTSPCTPSIDFATIPRPNPPSVGAFDIISNLPSPPTGLTAAVN